MHLGYIDMIKAYQDTAMRLRKELDRCEEGVRKGSKRARLRQIQVIRELRDLDSFWSRTTIVDTMPVHTSHGGTVPDY